MELKLHRTYACGESRDHHHLYVPLLGSGLLSDREGLGCSSYAGPIADWELHKHHVSFSEKLMVNYECYYAHNFRKTQEVRAGIRTQDPFA